jgi:hypothetical protein
MIIIWWNNAVFIFFLTCCNRAHSYYSIMSGDYTSIRRCNDNSLLGTILIIVFLDVTNHGRLYPHERVVLNVLKLCASTDDGFFFLSIVLLDWHDRRTSYIILNATLMRESGASPTRLQCWFPLLRRWKKLKEPTVSAAH